jgi:hypothetical protein
MMKKPITVLLLNYFDVNHNQILPFSDIPLLCSLNKNKIEYGPKANRRISSPIRGKLLHTRPCLQVSQMQFLFCYVPG